MVYSEDNEFPVTRVLWYAAREVLLVSGIAHSETVVPSIFQTLSLDVRRKRLWTQKRPELRRRFWISQQAITLAVPDSNA